MSEREHTLSKDCWCNPTIVNKNGYEYSANTRVRCTADGEFPNDEMVLFEDEGIIYIGGYMAKHDLWFTADNECDNKPVCHPIYWKPLTSLKEQYERERK